MRICKYRKVNKLHRTQAWALNDLFDAFLIPFFGVHASPERSTSLKEPHCASLGVFRTTGGAAARTFVPVFGVALTRLTVSSSQTNGGWQDAPTPSSVTSPTEGPGSVHSDTSNWRAPPPHPPPRPPPSSLDASSPEHKHGLTLTVLNKGILCPAVWRGTVTP